MFVGSEVYGPRGIKNSAHFVGFSLTQEASIEFCVKIFFKLQNSGKLFQTEINHISGKHVVRKVVPI